MPRGRPPKAVDPNASRRARLGAEIRSRRTDRKLTLDDLAPLVGYTPQHVSEVERANTTCSEEFVAALDRALGAEGAILALFADAADEWDRMRQDRRKARREALRSGQEVEEAKRRAFIRLGIATVLLGPEAARASAEDWDRIALAWAHEVDTAPDRQALLPGLLADLRRLGGTGPPRVSAQLASHVAGIAVSAGEAGAARRWWRMARSSAVASGDRTLIAYVIGKQAILGLYGPYTPAQVVALADEALSATTAPCTGRMHALSAQAQARAMLGRQRAANDALGQLERTFEHLPDAITRDKLSALGWAEERMHHTRSYCGMYGCNDGEAARVEALRLYASAISYWRGPIQTGLHTATSEADPQHAVALLGGLTDAQRSDRLVRMIAMRALATCESRGADTRELRDVLA